MVHLKLGGAIGLMLVCPCVFAEEAAKGAEAVRRSDGVANKEGNKKEGNKGEQLAMLEKAVNVFENQLKPGSSAALNQIAVAFYTLGENYEKTTEVDKSYELFKKASEYFCKAADAGCKEAVYNAGLAFSKLKKFDAAASYYRRCINSFDNETDSELALKAAVNLSILVLEKSIEPNSAEIASWVKLSEKYRDKKKADDLLQTTVVILTDINTVDDKRDGKQNIDRGDSKPGVAVKTANVTANSPEC